MRTLRIWFSILAVGVAASPLAADVIYDNGPLITDPGGGYGGADLSAMNGSLGAQASSFTNSKLHNTRVADDFVIPDGQQWRIDSIDFFEVYDTTDTSLPHVSGNLRIWDGQPGSSGSHIIFGDVSTDRMTSSIWDNAYRATDEFPDWNTMPIRRNNLSAGITLGAGVYWLDWQFEGSPFIFAPSAPPVTYSGRLGKTGANGLQRFNGTWRAATDPVVGNGYIPQDFPFQVIGAVVPEPSAILQIAVPLLALLRPLRRRA